MQVTKWKAARYIVEVWGVGAVFVGTREECNQYVFSQTARDGYTNEDLTASSAFESYQRS